MSAARIFATAQPTRRHGPIAPMDREQERFWSLLRKRKAEKEGRDDA